MATAFLSTQYGRPICTLAGIQHFKCDKVQESLNEEETKTKQSNHTTFSSDVCTVNVVIHKRQKCKFSGNSRTRLAINFTLLTSTRQK